MNDENTSSNNEASTREVWPRKLNKILISAGVLTFGLIIADRLVDMFQADDIPDNVELVNETEAVPVAEIPQVASEAPGNTPMEVTVSGDEDNVLEEDLNIENVFGSRLVFVSTSEPLYVITDDDRRIGIGDPINEETTLAGITGQRIILDKAGDLLPVQLPDLSEE